LFYKKHPKKIKYISFFLNKKSTFCQKNKQTFVQQPPVKKPLFLNKKPTHMFVKKLLFKKNNPKFQKNKQIFVQKQQKLILFYLLRKNINAKNKNFRDIQPLSFVIKKVKSRIKNNKFFFFSSRQKTKPKKRSKLKVSRKRGPWLPKKKYLKLRKKRKKQYKLIRKFNKKFFGFLLRRRRHR
jgi:hypothetical protein